MGLGKKTVTNSSWQFASITIRTMCQLVVIAVLARLLSPRDFGLVAMANLAIGFIAIFNRFGLTVALIQRKDLGRRHVEVAFTFSMLLGGAFIAIFWVVSPMLALFFSEPALVDVLRALSLAFLFTNIGNVSDALIQRNLQYKKLFFAHSVSYVAGYCSIGVTAAVLGAGVWSLVIASLATALFESAVKYGLERHAVRLRFYRQEFNDLIHFGWGETLSNLFNYAANNGDYFIIGRYLGPMLLGVYEQAFKIMLLPAKYFGDVLEQVLFASMSVIQNDKARVAAAYLRSASLLNSIMTPLSVLMIVVTPELVRILLGSQWTGAVLPAQILMVGVSFRNIGRISDGCSKAMGAIYNVSLRKGLYAAGIVVGSVGAVNFGIEGVACAVTGIVVMNCCFMVGLVLNLVQIPIKDYLISMLPGVGLGVLTLVVAPMAATISRQSMDQPLVTLSVTVFSVVLPVAGVFWFKPKVLGSEAIYLKNILISQRTEHRMQS